MTVRMSKAAMHDPTCCMSLHQITSLIFCSCHQKNAKRDQFVFSPFFSLPFCLQREYCLSVEVEISNSSPERPSSCKFSSKHLDHLIKDFRITLQLQAGVLEQQDGSPPGVEFDKRQRCFLIQTLCLSSMLSYFQPITYLSLLYYT